MKWPVRIKLIEERWYSMLHPGICWVSNNYLVVSNYYSSKCNTRRLTWVLSEERLVLHVRVKCTFHPKGRICNWIWERNITTALVIGNVRQDIHGRHKSYLTNKQFYNLHSSPYIIIIIIIPYSLTSASFRIVAHRNQSSAFFTPYFITDINQEGVVLTGNMRWRKRERKL